MGQSGWFRLCAGEHLMSKWGPGNWHLLRVADSGVTLLLVSFCGVEHALRLIEGEKVRFDCVSLRRTKEGQQSLTEDPLSVSRVAVPGAPVVCHLQGWPGLEA